MFRLLWQDCLTLISSPRCALCAGVAPAAGPALCPACARRLALPLGGVQGDTPLLWCALAPYSGTMRQVLLRQRPQPQPALVQAFATALHGCCGSVLPSTALVPIPSWKRRANPLPLLLARGLARAATGRCHLAMDLLHRSRVTVGQHHLNRQQRLGNQANAFRCTSPGRGAIWLVDDILTTGSTAEAAAAALQARGWAVQGLLCLARTPPRRPWRSPS
jgi:predicted amidophosphoribosyltransferase